VSTLSTSSIGPSPMKTPPTTRHNTKACLPVSGSQQVWVSLALSCGVTPNWLSTKSTRPTIVHRCGHTWMKCENSSTILMASSWNTSPVGRTPS
jgi:hypothetical protein